MKNFPLSFSIFVNCQTSCVMQKPISIAHYYRTRIKIFSRCAAVHALSGHKIVRLLLAAYRKTDSCNNPTQKSAAQRIKTHPRGFPREYTMTWRARARAKYARARGTEYGPI